MSARLETTSLTVKFGGLIAVDDVSLGVGDGELVGLIGPNGAGKTTCIDAITGFVPATGTVRFAGVDVSKLAPHQRARAGLARTFQSLELFDDLDVEENLLVAAERPSWWAPFVDLVRPRRRCREESLQWACDVLEIGSLLHRMPAELSLGQRKLVGVARALVAEPLVVLLDEPAAGLDSDESQALGAAIRRIVDHGTAVLLVDHDMGLVLGVCDRIYVLEFGSVIAHGTAAEVRADRRVIDAYLGGSNDGHAAAGDSTAGAASGSSS
jgi:branched-chain amino acid transport system ATP-binding protein